LGGQDFTALDVKSAGRVAIEFLVLAEGIVVGGLTYLLDPNMSEPAREIPRKAEAPGHPEEHDHYRRREEGRAGSRSIWSSSDTGRLEQ
jgi:hypothetical protein